eukprot:SAG22_NODE_3756_length_1543_cov_6.406510_3_plen_48_part_00
MILKLARHLAQVRSLDQRHMIMYNKNIMNNRIPYMYTQITQTEIKMT